MICGTTNNKIYLLRSKFSPAQLIINTVIRLKFSLNPFRLKFEVKENGIIASILIQLIFTTLQARSIIYLTHIVNFKDCKLESGQ